jgi:hypothetical protein
MTLAREISKPSKPRRLDQVGNSHTKPSGEFPIVGGEIPTEEGPQAKKQNGESH